MSVKPLVIFLFPYTPLAWDAERFGFAILRARGIAFKVLDVSLLLGGAPLKTQDDTIITVQNYQMLAQTIKAYAATSIFIDNLNGMTGFQWRSRHIFKLLKRYQATYYVVEIGALPMLSTQKTSWYANIKKAIDLKRAWHYLSYKIKHSLSMIEANMLHAYQMPVKIFTTYSTILTAYLQRYRLSQSSVVGIHSFDYDRYLTYQQGPKLPLHAKPYCVFIDQGLVYHRDFLDSVHGAPVHADTYFNYLNRFFSHIEHETGLEVIIAGSPRIDYAALPAMFEHRRVITGETLALIAQSELVLMHSSTAVSFAVLFNKPIMMLTTDEINRASGLGTVLANMAHELGLRPLPIDDASEVAQCELRYYGQWPRDYNRYKYRYIMSLGVEDQSIWDIVINELEKDFGYGTTSG